MNHKQIWIFVACLTLFEVVFMVYLTAVRAHLRYFNYVMFLPAIAAWIAWLSGREWRSIFASMTSRPDGRGFLFSALYPAVFLLALTGLVWLTGMGEYQPHKPWFRPPSPHLYGFVMAICLVLGEEWGWRGFLLPKLTARIGRFKAAFWVGVAWALFHAPIVYFLALTLKTADPLLLVLIHMATVLTFSFPFAYAYHRSNSIWAPVLFHYLWNWLNPLLLGNLYRNQSGVMKGNLLLLNGEGIFGCVLTLAFVYWYWRRHRGEGGE